MRPAKLTKEEEEGFEAYTIAAYKADLKLATRIVAEWKKERDEHLDLPFSMTSGGIVGYVFDKLATPRVFLIDKWRALDPEDRRKYYPKEEQERQAEEARRTSEKARGILS